MNQFWHLKRFIINCIIFTWTCTVNGTISSNHIFVCVKYASHGVVLSYAVSLVGDSRWFDRKSTQTEIL